MVVELYTKSTFTCANLNRQFTTSLSFPPEYANTGLQCFEYAFMRRIARSIFLEVSVIMFVCFCGRVRLCARSPVREISWKPFVDGDFGSDFLEIRRRYYCTAYLSRPLTASSRLLYAHRGQCRRASSRSPGVMQHSFILTP